MTDARITVSKIRTPGELISLTSGRTINLILKRKPDVGDWVVYCPHRETILDARGMCNFVCASWERAMNEAMTHVRTCHPSSSEWV